MYVFCSFDCNSLLRDDLNVPKADCFRKKRAEKCSTVWINSMDSSCFLRSSLNTVNEDGSTLRHFDKPLQRLARWQSHGIRTIDKEVLWFKPSWMQSQPPQRNSKNSQSLSLRSSPNSPAQSNWIITDVSLIVSSRYWNISAKNARQRQSQRALHDIWRDCEGRYQARSEKARSSLQDNQIGYAEGLESCHWWWIARADFDTRSVALFGCLWLFCPAHLDHESIAGFNGRSEVCCQ